MMVQTFSGLQLQSTITGLGQLRLELAEVEHTNLDPDEVLVRVEAAPINPSDIALLLGPADLDTLQATGSADRPLLSASVPSEGMPAMLDRVDQALAVGNEGAGTVVATGRDVTHLLDKRVGMQGGGMYAQFRSVPVNDCVVLPDWASAADGAAMFVNPLTALCFVETMKAEGHRAIVHFAAASNLGQMLNRLCLRDGIPLVNVVRRPEQVPALRGAGAEHVVDSSDADFEAQLIEAVSATGATLAFDPISGGRQTSQVLAAMETAASRRSPTYSRYGSGIYKQVYVYGVLDSSPIILDRWMAYSWGVCGWLMPSRLERLGPDGARRLRSRIVDELTTTFASHYTGSLTLTEMLDPANVKAFARKATGQKYLLRPNAEGS